MDLFPTLSNTSSESGFGNEIPASCTTTSSDSRPLSTEFVFVIDQRHLIGLSISLDSTGTHQDDSRAPGS